MFSWQWCPLLVSPLTQRKGEGRGHAGPLTEQKGGAGFPDVFWLFVERSPCFICVQGTTLNQNSQLSLCRMSFYSFHRNPEQSGKVTIASNTTKEHPSLSISLNTLSAAAEESTNPASNPANLCTASAHLSFIENRLQNKTECKHQRRACQILQTALISNCKHTPTRESKSHSRKKQNHGKGVTQNPDQSTITHYYYPIHSLHSNLSSATPSPESHIHSIVPDPQSLLTWKKKTLKVFFLELVIFKEKSRE